MSTNTTSATVANIAITSVKIWISTIGIATLTGMCSSVHGLRTQRRKKKKRFILRTTCYCKDNNPVNVSVFGLVEKELGFEKNGSKKRVNFLLIFIFRCKLIKLGKLGRVYTSLSSVNSVKLVKPSNFTKNWVYLWVNTILVPKNVNSVNSKC